ncbi:MAG: hypothetical protein K2X63_05180 [Burkholderiaceae bacterium]|nr:hypothetical protein [Burkholderiaceae bacterium]
MIKPLFQFIILFSAVALSAPLHAQEEPATKSADIFDSPQSVEIIASKDPDSKLYRNLLKGLEAFEKYHAAAPQAEPKFILKPRKEGLDDSHLSARIAYDEISIPVQVANDATFTLPRNAEAKEKNAEVLLNQKKNLYRWWPYIRSPQLAPNQRRLGDLRLECQMLWAVYYDEIPFFVRNIIRAFGGPCTTSKVSISYPAEFIGLQAATLKQGEQTMALKVNAKQSGFAAPLADKNWSDDAIIELQYEETGQPKHEINYAGFSASVGL